MLTASLIMLAAVFTNMTDLARGIRNKAIDADFDVVGRLVSVPNQGASDFFIDDGANRPIGLYDSTHASNSVPFRRGDLVRAKGVIRRLGMYSNIAAQCNELALVKSNSPPPAFAQHTIGELVTGDYDRCPVAVVGTVCDAFRDEIDSHVFFLVLESDGDLIYVVHHSFDNASPRLFRLVGGEVRVSGVFVKKSKGSLRPLLGNLISIDSLDGLEVIRAPGDPFAVPLLPASRDMLADDVRKLGRCRTVGRVLAAWGGNRALLKCADEQLVGVTFADDRLPQYGDLIEAAGFAETDLYSVNLARAVWRIRPPTGFLPPKVSARNARTLFVDKHGKSIINQSFHGALVCLEGVVKTPAGTATGERQLEIDDGEYAISVETANCGEKLPTLSPGATVRVTGIFVIDTGKWDPSSVFPRTRGCLLVPRNADDVTLLRRPPWWTTKRLLLLVGALLAALVSIAVWNRVLNRLVEQRSRQLLKATVAQEQAALRAEERTRLAVELHDTIAQNLTGAALQLDAIELAAEHAPGDLPAHVANARRTLRNCRENLRNCLWDLRSRVLEEPHFSDAIRRTVQPLADTVAIDIDCEGATRRFSDNASHAVLCIVRELVTNAVRHGHATRISIVGKFAGGRFSLAVRDDGVGFSPNVRPGIREGHFGLQGVAERVRRLGGSLAVESAPGRGARITVTEIQPS